MTGSSAADTTLQHEEAGPALREILAGQADGLHVGAQLYVSIAGAPVLDLACGESRAGTPMRTDTIVPWYCAGKPLTAVALCQLVEKGRLDFHDSLGEYLPDLADPAVHRVSLVDLLSHRVGFDEDGFSRAIGVRDWDEIVRVALACPMEYGWDVRRRARYSLWLAWILLGEIVRRVDGRPVDVYVRDEVLQAAGLTDCWLVMSPDEYRANANRLAVSHATFNGVIEPLESVSMEAAGTCSPGFGARGPVRELGRFYEELLRVRRGAPSSLLSTDTLGYVTATHREGLFDELLNADTSWGLGFVVDPRRFGDPCSRAVFGHPGLQSVIALADPAHELVIAFAANGMPEVYRDIVRQRAVVSAVYQELGLAATKPDAGRSSRRRRRAAARNAPEASAPLRALSPAEFMSTQWFENLLTLAQTWPRIPGATANVQFVFTGDDGPIELAVQLRSGRLATARNDSLARPDVTISLTQDTARLVLTGVIDANLAIERGDVDFEGSIHKVMRITPVRASQQFKRTLRALGDATALRSSEGTG